MARSNNKLLMLALKNTPIILFVVVFVVFGVLSPRFFSLQNFENLLRQSSYIGIIAVGMTFVLLTGGIDLSVGAIMYVAAVIFGKMVEAGMNPWLAVAAGMLAGTFFGAINAFFITKLKIIPFMVTLGTLTALRGLGLFMTKSYPLHIPDNVKIGAIKFLGFIPVPIFLFGLVVLIAFLVLNLTPIGRQIYAVGNDVEAAKKAGLNTDSVLATVYIISGFCAAMGGLIALSMQGSVQAGFGTGDEFDAIAGSVLGGTSLFGGVGTVFPGTVLGMVLIQMIQAGLVYIQLDLYIQPLVTAGVIFLAVFIDAFRSGLLKKMERRNIRMQRETETKTEVNTVPTS